MFRRGILIFWGQTTLNGHNSNNDNNNDDYFVHNVHFSFQTLKLSGLLEEIDNKGVMSLNPGNGSFYTFIYCKMQLFKTPKIFEKEREDHQQVFDDRVNKLSQAKSVLFKTLSENDK